MSYPVTVALLSDDGSQASDTLDDVDPVPCRFVGMDGPPMPLPEPFGMIRSRREPCAGIVAAKLPVKLPRLVWLHRSRTPAEPTMPKSDQLAVTVAVPLPRLNSATV